MGGGYFDYLSLLVEEYGAVGLFAAAFINNFPPGLPPVYLTLVSAYAVADPSNWYLGVLGAGLGAGLGKVAQFMAAGALASRVSRVRAMRRYASAVMGGRRAKLSIALLVFLAASLPLPDELIYIPLGAAAFSLSYFTVAVVAGKIVLVSAAYAFGSAFRVVVTSSESPLVVAALAAASLGASALLTASLFLLDWERVYEAYASRGGGEALRVLLDEVRRLPSTFRDAASKTLLRALSTLSR